MMRLPLLKQQYITGARARMFSRDNGRDGIGLDRRGAHEQQGDTRSGGRW
jgi:hypothetical protein